MTLLIFLSVFLAGAGAVLLCLFLPPWLAALCAAALCAVLALLLTRQLVRPLTRLNLDHPDAGETYPELAPLVRRLREQNRIIRRQTDELSIKQREFSAITENMSEGFLLLDAHETMISGNHSAMGLIAPDPWDGERNLARCGCRPEILQAVRSALAGVRSVQTMHLQSASYQVIASPVTDPAGSVPAGAVMIILDVTEREQRETLRREFSANVSHELKTPLTSISGFAELLKDGLVEADKQREFAGDIYKESRRLMDLVDDILRLSSLDEDSAQFEPEDVDLYDLAQQALDSLRAAAQRQNVTLSLQGPHVTIRGVWQVLSEVVFNLCDNAVKYNRPGGSLTVTLAQDGAGAHLTVSDTGIGIPLAQQDRVFERFYRVDKSHSKQVGGTGLGLSIVKHGVQYHGGQVTLHSEPGQGTTVSVLLPTQGGGLQAKEKLC